MESWLLWNIYILISCICNLLNCDHDTAIAMKFCLDVDFLDKDFTVLLGMHDQSCVQLEHYSSWPFAGLFQLEKKLGDQLVVFITDFLFFGVDCLFFCFVFKSTNACLYNGINLKIPKTFFQTTDSTLLVSNLAYIFCFGLISLESG